MKSFSILLLAVIFAGLGPSSDLRGQSLEDRGAKTTTAPAAKTEDVGSVDAILKALYDTISGPKGSGRDWNRLRSLFHSSARLMPVQPAREGTQMVLRPLSVEDYIKRAGPFLEREGFFETEISRAIHQFGHIVQVFSTYETRHAKEDEKPFARGINSVQLFNDGTRWWVVSVLWEQETPDLPIPPEFQKK